MWFSGRGTKLAYAAFNETLVPTVSMQHYGVPETMYDQYSKTFDYHYPKVSHRRIIRVIPCVQNRINIYSNLVQVDDPNPTVELFVQNLSSAMDEHVPIAIKPVKNYE